jgi:hypothetical protein
MKQIKRRKQEGAALLVVLFIVMTVTILSLGYLSRSDIESACGENMILRAQMDYLAESGLEHARGLILNPQDVGSEYWQGGMIQQLYSGNDYYDVNITQHDPCDGPTYRCNYDITCEAYRDKSGEKIGRSILKAELRLDPCIALWTGRDMAVSGAVVINGDVYCNGTLTNEGVINGDVFAGVLSGSIAGQHKTTGDLSLEWPRVTVADFTSHYSEETISTDNLYAQTLGSCNPVRVCYRNGNLMLSGNVQIEGMLIVEGDLIVRGDGNIITAAKNLPALLVTRDVIIEDGGGLDVDGLVVVDGDVQVSADSNNVGVLGGLFVAGSVAQTTADSSGNGNTAMLYDNPSWQPSGGQIDGALGFDGTNDYVQTPDDASKLQLTGDYTLAVWIKADVTEKDWAGILSKCDPSGSINHWTLQFDNANPKKLIVHHSIGSWDTGIRLGGVAGAWHHIRIVRSGDWMTSYLDGTEKHSNTWSENPGSGNGHLNIGADRNALSNYVYKGLIDDVRIYDCAPDANETYPSVDPIAHWKLDEPGANVNVTAVPSKTAIVLWSEAGVAEKWGQAAGAFFRSIERK